MKLIVGLGNPGKKYVNTRHNVGFDAIDSIAKQYNISVETNKFNGLYGLGNINNEKVMLLKPQSFMNLSGEVIAKYVSYFKVDISDVLVICDDLDTELGKYRIRYQGGSGNHNGLKNIELNLNTKNYKRIRIGISNTENKDKKDYVLGKFSIEQKSLLEKVISLIPMIIYDYTELEFDNLMNKYNK